MSEPSDRPTRLFVTGVGRSGTSLLQAMLGSHPDIAFLPETGFLRRACLAGGAAATRPLDERERRALERSWREDRRLGRVSTASAAIETTVAAADADGRSASALALELYERLIPTGAVRFVGDKDPRLVEHIETLAALWPDARIVHIHRDPRDVLASKKAARWAAGQSTLRQVSAAAAQLELAFDAERRLSPSTLHTVAYERLLAAPEGTLRGLCDWLGIDYSPAMLAFSSTARALVAPDELDWKRQTLGPLLGDNSGRWAERLSAFETALVESACAPLMRRGGHSPAPGLGFGVRVAGALAGRATRVAAATYVAVRRRTVPAPRPRPPEP